jgi:hypothetical protein
MHNSLAADSRLVTPPGSHEVSLSRLLCTGDNSGPAAVVRDLSVNTGNTSIQAAKQQIITGYVHRGWEQDSYSRNSASNGDRDVTVKETPNSHLEVGVSDSVFYC